MYEQGVVALTADIAEDRTRSSPGVSYLWAWAVRATAQVANDGIVLQLVAVRESGKAESYSHVALEVEVVSDSGTEHPQPARLPPYDREFASNRHVLEIAVGRSAQRGYEGVAVCSAAAALQLNVALDSSVVDYHPKGILGGQVPGNRVLCQIRPWSGRKLGIVQAGIINRLAAERHYAARLHVEVASNR